MNPTPRARRHRMLAILAGATATAAVALAGCDSAATTPAPTITPPPVTVQPAAPESHLWPEGDVYELPSYEDGGHDDYGTYPDTGSGPAASSGYGLGSTSPNESESDTDPCAFPGDYLCPSTPLELPAPDLGQYGW